ncbi:MAG: hypothetical protein Q4P23_01680 [Micrococcaceae bacterium]|nr:hypothetical protein [Micrococcaceae bacterium]
MPWIIRGLRNGVLTSKWPSSGDEYFDTFHATIDVDLEAAVNVDPGTLDDVAKDCPTAAISTVPGLRLDRGQCILCGRCVDSLPAVFRWAPGSGAAALSLDQLLVGDLPETTETVELLRTELAAKVRSLRRSIHIRHVDAGSDGADEWEIQALLNPVYDIHRLGIFFTASPRHADILLVTGIGTAGMTDALRATRAAMPDPVVVIASGTDAVGGGLIGGGYTQGSGIGELLGVDLLIPGSPPSPFTLLHAFLLALGRFPSDKPTYTPKKRDRP